MGRRIAEYDSEALYYDESRFSDRLGRHLDYMHKRIVEKLLNSSGKLILDAGVGTGRFATWLAKRGFKVIGVDLSPEMLKVAKRKIKLLNVDIELVLADLHFLPFRYGTFDSCVCINVVDHLTDIGKFLSELRLVLKPKGIFVLNFSNILSPYLPIALLVNFKGKALFKGGKISSKWFTSKQMATLLSQSGFNIRALHGCMIASPLPLGNRLIKLVQAVNLSTESSKLKFFSGSMFIKVQHI
jgi:2-polyprenyl-3-methyl-5-hydroxy-6-metoxy-1,4-benzoquinol methylase